MPHTVCFLASPFLGGQIKMKSMSLKLLRADLQQALKTLGAIRKKRGASIVPVWLHFDPLKSALSITEARGRAIAVLPAMGSWTPAGATVDMFSLRRLMETLDDVEIEMIVAPGQIIIPTPRGHVALTLQPFGPESKRKPHASTPLGF